MEKLTHKHNKKSFKKPLSKGHQITQLSVNNYLDSKILASWSTVDYQLKHKDNIEPVKCDEEFLQNVKDLQIEKQNRLKERMVDMQIFDTIIFRFMPNVSSSDIIQKVGF